MSQLHNTQCQENENHKIGKHLTRKIIGWIKLDTKYAKAQKARQGPESYSYVLCYLTVIYKFEKYFIFINMVTSLDLYWKVKHHILIKISNRQYNMTAVIIIWKRFMTYAANFHDF